MADTVHGKAIVRQQRDEMAAFLNEMYLCLEIKGILENCHYFLLLIVLLAPSLRR